MTDNLSIPVVAAAQNQKEVTINAATAQLSGALADFLSADLSAGNYTLSTANFQKYMGFSTTGNAVARDFTVPAVKRALFYIQNGGSATVSVKRGTTTLSLTAGSVGFFQTDGTSNGMVSAAPVALGGELDISMAFSGKPLTAQSVNIPLNQAIELLTALPGSNFFVGTDPTSTATFTLNKNGSSIGTVAIGTGGAATVTFTGDVSFAIGDVFNVTCPSPQDATLADVGLSFKAVKV